MATWVVGDIHGCYETFMSLLENPEIREDDTIILIGDIIDRGPDTLKMIKWAMDNISENGKYQMICGNHEDNVINDYNRVKAFYDEGRLSDSSSPMETMNKRIPFENVDILKLNCHYDFDSYMEGFGYKTVGSVKHIIDWFRSLPLTKHVTVIDAEGKRSVRCCSCGSSRLDWLFSRWRDLPGFICLRFRSWRWLSVFCFTGSFI